MHLQIPMLLQVIAGHSGLVVSAHDCAGSNLTACGCVYRDGHCDMQSSTGSAHLLQFLGQLSLASLHGRKIEYHLRPGLKVGMSPLPAGM